MESYSTEEEQVEAIKRWWQENGRSTVAAIVIALAAGFGWQFWKDYDLAKAESASIIYQNLLQSLNAQTDEPSNLSEVRSLAQQLKAEHAGTGYAQFAALHLAKIAAQDSNPEEAKVELRWALAQADSGSDVANIAQLRLARIMASSGEPEQALDLLAAGKDSPYAASYAIAEGDIYMQLQRIDEAKAAYAAAKLAMEQGSVDGTLATLENKIQSLNPVAVRVAEAVEPTPMATADSNLDNREG